MEINQKFKNFQEERINATHRKLKWNHYKLIRKLSPYGTTDPIDVESRIQLNMTDLQFPGSLCTLTIDFQAAIDEPINYLLRNI
jgi:hypothetical protein